MLARGFLHCKTKEFRSLECEANIKFWLRDIE
jgi:hypothetical protein